MLFNKIKKTILKTTTIFAYAFSSQILLSAVETHNIAVADNIYQKVDQGIVCLEAQKTGNRRTIGTAFFVAPGILVATNHQVQDAESLLIHYRPLGRAERRLYPAKVLLTQPDSDLSVLQVDFKNHPILPIGDSTNLILGEEVFTVGCPLGLDHSLAKGFVSQPRRTLKNKLYVQVDMGINHGNSGGPLVTKQGKVVGVIHGRIKQSEQIGLAVPSEILLKVAQLSENQSLNQLDQEQQVNPYQNSTVNAGDLQERFNSIFRDTDLASRLRRLSQFNREYPDLPEPYFYLGSTYYSLKDMNNASKYYHLTIQRFPNYYKAYTSLALIQHNQKQFDYAKANLIKSIQLNDQYARSHLILGLVFQNGDKNTRLAIDSFQRYVQLEKNPNNRQKVQQLIDRLKKNEQRRNGYSVYEESRNKSNNDFMIIQ